MIRKVQVGKKQEIGERAVSFHFGPIKGIAFKRGEALKAYVNRCTHMGGPVDFCHEGTLRCGWHGADFDPDTGAAVRVRREDLAELVGCIPETAIRTLSEFKKRGWIRTGWKRIALLNPDALRRLSRSPANLP
jgi:nitrite reductase/ring-hydroxylating ferredoxin subunit